ncbi:MAG: oligosaccharide flippase family protein [Gammaproteobacteria bacterium]|nr:oligosaccharide flippase family protein [Gammaproteobacteria bacterium]
MLILADLYGNGIRLAANLITTRLLFPEAFGLMLIVNLVLGALDMLSDMGVRGSVMVKEGEITQRYLHTAWTIGVIRGGVLALLTVMLAYPISQFYDNDQLIVLLLIASLSPLVKGFTSPVPMLAEKKVQFTRVVVWQGLVQTITIIVLVAWLFVFPSVWALAAHGVLHSLLLCGTSYWFFPYGRMRACLDKDSFAQIFGFGKWVFIASGLTFLARQGDSVVISKWMTSEQLGVFSIAVTFAKLVEMLVERMSWSLLFPVYAEIQQTDRSRFEAQVKKVKLVLYGICAGPILLFGVFGRDLVQFLYDPRYHSAGYILEALAAGSVFFAAGAAILNVPMSFGDSYRHMLIQGIRFLLLLVLMTIGGALAGISGLIVGIVVSQAFFYLALRLMTQKYGLRGYGVDLAFITVMVFAIGVAWFLRGLPKIG